MTRISRVFSSPGSSKPTRIYDNPESELSMAIQIGAKPDGGFEDPIGMLKDCHRPIERFLHILSVVSDRAAGRALTDEETEAVQSSLQYFRQGGLGHTADEEESLFPRLRRESWAGDFKEISGLEDDHREADALHSAVDALYLKADSRSRGVIRRPGMVSLWSLWLG
jgi:hypothetical protein